MKKEEVPQDKSSLSKSNLKEVVYAVDKDGNYGKALSSGWETKNTILNESLELIEERLQATVKELKSGVASPIAYYMEKQRMDITILSSYVGLWKWRVKRHLKAGIFDKMSEKMMIRYADVFDISLEELKNPKI